MKSLVLFVLKLMVLFVALGFLAVALPGCSTVPTTPVEEEQEMVFVYDDGIPWDYYIEQACYDFELCVAILNELAMYITTANDLYNKGEITLEHRDAAFEYYKPYFMECYKIYEAFQYTTESQGG